MEWPDSLALLSSHILGMTVGNNCGLCSVGQCTGWMALDTEWPQPGAVGLRESGPPAHPSFSSYIVVKGLGGAACSPKSLSCENKRRWKGKQAIGEPFVRQEQPGLFCSEGKGAGLLPSWSKGREKHAPPKCSSCSVLCLSPLQISRHFCNSPFSFLCQSLTFPIPKIRGKGLVCYVKVNIENLSVSDMC